MTRLIPVADTLERSNRLLDVVFVHGAGGKPFLSWGQLRNKHGGERDSMLYWLLDEPDLQPAMGVWTLEHSSDKTWGGSQGSMGRDEVAEPILAAMMESIGGPALSLAESARCLCWIGHSEGGNVVKQFLRYCQEQRDGQLPRAKSAARVYDATKFIYFLDTPHQGTWIATKISNIPVVGKFVPRRRVRELRDDDPALRNLHRWYLDILAKRVRSYNFHQTDERFKAVNTASAILPGAEFNFPIDADHNRLAKPESKSDSPYKEIKASLAQLYVDLQSSQNPVPTAPLPLNHVRFAQEPLRLLIFVEPELEEWDPSEARGRRYRLRLWLTQGNGLPTHLDQAMQEQVSEDQLAPRISEVYTNQLNSHDDDTDVRLLLNLFLPLPMLVAAELPKFLADLSCCARGRQQACDGIPVLLACSSRWPVGAAYHELQNTRAALREASQRLVRTLYEPKANPPSLASLSWLRLESAPPPGLDPHLSSGAQNQPKGLSSVEPVASVAQPPAKATDPLVDCDAVYLADWPQAAETCAELPQAIERLVSEGIPLIWRAGPGALQGHGQRRSGAEAPHPMDEILDWDGLTLLGWFYRYCSKRPGRHDEQKLVIRNFIRQGIIYWEDHRHVPTVPTVPSSAFSEASQPGAGPPASPLPMTVPFHPFSR